MHACLKLFPATGPMCCSGRWPLPLVFRRRWWRRWWKNDNAIGPEFDRRLQPSQGFEQLVYVSRSLCFPLEQPFEVLEFVFQIFLSFAVFFAICWGGRNLF